MKTARVVAAVVRRAGRILITRRKDEAERGGLWEFPGGKVEPGEEEPDALRREIREELGCDIRVHRLLLRHSHRYPDLAVELAFYECELAAGQEPLALGVAGMEWAQEGTLSGRPFCEADVPVLAALERPPSGPG
jgi:8-oxo-dGTP diphosphatase